MSSPIFILKDGLLTGSYLLGEYAWSEAMRIESANLIALPPRSGAVTITLEVAGALTEKKFTLAASELVEVRQALPLNLKLTAGQTLRWRVTAAEGEIENAADHISIALHVYREVDAVVPDEALTVWWQHGPEWFKLFTYDPLTHLYTAVNAALASPRATITTSPDFSIAIQGGEVLRAESAALYTAALVAGGLQVAAQPQLKFYVGVNPVAVLTHEGVLHVPGANQVTPVAQLNQFWLGSVATLQASGVVASQFEQPL